MTFDDFQLVRPCIGERVSGDIAVTKPLASGLMAAIVDVSGHGPEAYELAIRLEQEILNWPNDNLTGLMRRLHETAHASRGAAVGLAALHDNGTLRYVGAGNTRIQKFGGQPWKGLSRDGVIGSRLPTLREESTELAEGDVITLFTDGLSERISAREYPRLELETPPMIAHNLIKLFGKSYDDSSCIVIKCRA